MPTPWLGFAFAVSGRSGFVRADHRPRAAHDGSTQRQATVLGRPPVKSICVVAQRDSLVDFVASRLRSLASPAAAAAATSSPPTRFATTHLLGGRRAARPRRLPPLLPSVCAPPFALNAEQAAVVADVESGEALTLCCGPPGTGKTTTSA